MAGTEGTGARTGTGAGAALGPEAMAVVEAASDHCRLPVRHPTPCCEPRLELDRVKYRQMRGCVSVRVMVTVARLEGSWRATFERSNSSMLWIVARSSAARELKSIG